MKIPANRIFAVGFASLLAIAAIVYFATTRTNPSDRVVLYSAQDREFAERLLDECRGEHGMTVDAKFDTEANKSVGLATELEREAGQPRCDLHWNNEPLGTIRLARKGLYAPYSSSIAVEFPAGSRDRDDLWQAFAERARVLIVNTDLVPEAERPKGLFDLADPRWRGKIAMAKPQFGTTATHAACLFEVLGREAAKGLFRGLKANSVELVAGNKQVARKVADGTFAVGTTDTDDAIIEVMAGKPVAIVFPDAKGHPDHPRLGALFLPNTLAIVKGGPNPAGARALYDAILKSEASLAGGGAYQFPLRPGIPGPNHPALEPHRTTKRMAVDFEKAADLWDEVQTFLRDEFAR